jgi:hypothetical protein
VTARRRPVARPLTPAQYRLVQAKDMTEVPALTGQMVNLCRLTGWRVHHGRPGRTADSWRTAIQGHPGFPDVIAVHRVVPVAVAAELKRYVNGESPRERPDAAQRVWLDLWARLPAVYSVCWTTLDWIDRTPQCLLADPDEVLRLAVAQAGESGAAISDIIATPLLPEDRQA